MLWRRSIGVWSSPAVWLSLRQSWGRRSCHRGQRGPPGWGPAAPGPWRCISHRGQSRRPGAGPRLQRDRRVMRRAGSCTNNDTFKWSRGSTGARTIQVRSVLGMRRWAADWGRRDYLWHWAKEDELVYCSCLLWQRIMYGIECTGTVIKRSMT